ncbi:N/A [soil metagenome]
MSTRERILEEALRSFALHGYGATSLDALAGHLGVRKQTILYHFASKDALLTAVIDEGAGDLAGALETAVAAGADGFARVEAIVDAVFRLGAHRPELLELLREITRLGPPASTRLTQTLDPLLRRAGAYLAAAGGGLGAPDPRRVILTACAMVIGTATEVEVLRTLGVEPDLASLRRRRRALLDYLHHSLVR